MPTPQRIEPGPGQESVWDYPRPPRVEKTGGHVQVIFNGIILADTRRARRVLETSHPPVYYIPPEDIQMEYLERTAQTTWCEWKGQAGYYTVTIGEQQVRNGAWSYPHPVAAYASLKDYVAFYPGLLNGSLLRRWRASPGPTGGFLWRLDYLGDCRPL